MSCTRRNSATVGAVVVIIVQIPVAVSRFVVVDGIAAQNVVVASGGRPMVGRRRLVVTRFAAVAFRRQTVGGTIFAATSIGFAASLHGRLEQWHLVRRQEEQRMVFVVVIADGRTDGGQMADGQFAVGRLAKTDCSELGYIMCDTARGWCDENEQMKIINNHSTQINSVKTNVNQYIFI